MCPKNWPIFPSFDETRAIEIIRLVIFQIHEASFSPFLPREIINRCDLHPRKTVSSTPPPHYRAAYFPRPRFIEEYNRPMESKPSLWIVFRRKRDSSPSFSPFPLADGRGKNFIKIPLVRGGSSMRVFPSVKAQLWNRRRRRERVTQSDAPLFSSLSSRPFCTLITPYTKWSAITRVPPKHPEH